MGLIIPFISNVLKKKASYEFIGVRPATCAPEVYGEYRYDLLPRKTRGHYIRCIRWEQRQIYRL